MIQRPTDLFDREWEWEALVRHVESADTRSTLGVVSGRRRQGKSYLLERLCDAADGFYHAAIEGTDDENRWLLAQAIGRHENRPAPELRNWSDAAEALLYLSVDRPRPIVLDEFPFLCAAASALPSVMQAAVGRPPVAGRAGARLILCGSARRFMGGLLSGQAPLRGRAGLELVIDSFDFRTAARFWNVADWRLAVRLQAVVGGTPAYAREFTDSDHPANANDFPDWLRRTILSPSSPLHREGRYLLAEDLEVRDTALYHSVLAAVAAGNASRGGIANYTGRPADALVHPLTVLEDASFIVRSHDLFNSRRSTFQIAEPVIGFYHAIVRPNVATLANPKNAPRVWEASAHTFEAQLVGPRFESLCRDWILSHASGDTIGGVPARVGVGTINDAANKTLLQLDLAAYDADGRLLAIGESKWGQSMGVAHLERLRRARSLLAAGGHDVSTCKLIMCSGADFAPAVQGFSDVVLVDLERLYTGE